MAALLLAKSHLSPCMPSANVYTVSRESNTDIVSMILVQQPFPQIDGDIRFVPLRLSPSRRRSTEYPRDTLPTSVRPVNETSHCRYCQSSSQPQPFGFPGSCGSANEGNRFFPLTVVQSHNILTFNSTASSIDYCTNQSRQRSIPIPLRS